MLMELILNGLFVRAVFLIVGVCVIAYFPVWYVVYPLMVGFFWLNMVDKKWVMFRKRLRRYLNESHKGHE